MSNFPKPESLEENLAIIEDLYQSFMITTNSFIWDMNDVKRKYTDPQYYTYCIANGLINPSTTYEIELSKINYAILGFAIISYEKIAYALDFWIRKRTRDRDNATTFNCRNLSIAEEKLAKLKQILPSDKGLITKYRITRNEYAHRGMTEFPYFFLQNRSNIYNLIVAARWGLLELKNSKQFGLSFDEAKYSGYMEMQQQYLNQLLEWSDQILSSEIA